MPGLLDIAISSRTVSIGESEVPVYGVSAKGIAVLFERFPIFREMFSGRTPDLSPEAVTKLAPEAVAAIIAAGVPARSSSDIARQVRLARFTSLSPNSEIMPGSGTQKNPDPHKRPGSDPPAS